MSRVEHATRSSRIGVALIAASARCSGGRALLGRSADATAARGDLRLRRAGEPVEPARRLCRPGFGRSAGLRRSWRLCIVRARDFAGRASDRCHPDRRADRRPGCNSGRCADFPSARGLFRDRHLGRRRGVSPAGFASLCARRRLRHQPSGSRRYRHGAEPADARIRNLLAGT